MKTQRAQHSCTAFSSTWTSLKLGRVGKANIHTYVLICIEAMYVGGDEDENI